MIYRKDHPEYWLLRAELQRLVRNKFRNWSTQRAIRELEAQAEDYARRMGWAVRDFNPKGTRYT